MIKVTVVVPTRDRADRLAICLESLTRQTVPQESFEVIVVDNGSTDRTAEVAHSFSTRLNLVYVFEPNLGLHYGRHAGMRNARAEVLMFGEDDLIVEPGWVEAGIKAMADGTVSLAGGNLLPYFEGDIPDWLNLWWSRPVYRGRAFGYLGILDFGAGRFDVDPAYVWGGNFCVRRKVLEAVGGFHPDGMPKEFETRRGDGESYTARAIHARGGVVRFDSGITVRHTVIGPRMDQAYLERRAYSQGISDSYTETRRRGAPRGKIDGWAMPRLRKLRRELAYRREARGGDETAAKLLAIQVATLGAWIRGYEFHQHAVRQDAALIDWILKENYL